MAFRTIWENSNGNVVVIDQRYLPHRLIEKELSTYTEVLAAINDMVVRGAPLIGVTASYGVYLAARTFAILPDFKRRLLKAINELRASRPTAVNLYWALNKMQACVENSSDENLIENTLICARDICENDVALCRMIGVHGLPLIEDIYKREQRTVNILTHCNAGMLGCVEWGTVTSPIYQAIKKGIPVHVWVDETRPRNQGANLTAYELNKHNVPYTVVVDNTGGHLMQHGKVDLAIVGADRVTANGDTANKIGTYLKALAAADNNIPFYVALPSTTIDWDMKDGINEIPIEERNPDEVKYVYGQMDDKNYGRVLITPENANAANFGFDVTPARLITGLITEKGICKANNTELKNLFNVG